MDRYLAPIMYPYQSSGSPGQKSLLKLVLLVVPCVVVSICYLCTLVTDALMIKLIKERKIKN